MSNSDDVDFRALLRGTTCHILLNLADALENEKEAFGDLAATMEYNNYFDLMHPQHFTKVLSNTFDLKDCDTTDVSASASDPSKAKKDFAALLRACQTAKYKQPYLSNQEYAYNFRKAGKLTQRALDQSYDKSDISALKLELQFFARCLDFLKGVTAEPEKIYENIEEVIAVRP